MGEFGAEGRFARHRWRYLLALPLVLFLVLLSSQSRSQGSALQCSPDALSLSYANEVKGLRNSHDFYRQGFAEWKKAFGVDKKLFDFVRAVQTGAYGKQLKQIFVSQRPRFSADLSRSQLTGEALLIGRDVNLNDMPLARNLDTAMTAVGHAFTAADMALNIYDALQGDDKAKLSAVVGAYQIQEARALAAIGAESLSLYLGGAAFIDIALKEFIKYEADLYHKYWWTAYEGYLNKTYPDLVKGENSWAQVAMREGMTGINKRLGEFWDSKGDSSPAIRAAVFYDKLPSFTQRNALAIATLQKPFAARYFQDSLLTTLKTFFTRKLQEQEAEKSSRIIDGCQQVLQSLGKFAALQKLVEKADQIRTAFELPKFEILGRAGGSILDRDVGKVNQGDSVVFQSMVPHPIFDPPLESSLTWSLRDEKGDEVGGFTEIHKVSKSGGDGFYVFSAPTSNLRPGAYRVRLVHALTSNPESRYQASHPLTVHGDEPPITISGLRVSVPGNDDARTVPLDAAARLTANFRVAEAVSQVAVRLSVIRPSKGGAAVTMIHEPEFSVRGGQSNTLGVALDPVVFEAGEALIFKAEISTADGFSESREQAFSLARKPMDEEPAAEIVVADVPEVKAVETEEAEIEAGFNSIELTEDGSDADADMNQESDPDADRVAGESLEDSFKGDSSGGAETAIAEDEAVGGRLIPSSSGSIVVTRDTYDGPRLAPDEMVELGQILAFQTAVEHMGSGEAPVLANLSWQLFGPDGRPIDGVSKGQQISAEGGREEADCVADSSFVGCFRIRLDSLSNGYHRVAFTYQNAASPDLVEQSVAVFGVFQPVNLTEVLVDISPQGTTHHRVLYTDQAPHVFAYYELGDEIEVVSVYFRIAYGDTGELIEEQTLERPRKEGVLIQRVGLRLEPGAVQSGREVEILAVVTSPDGRTDSAAAGFTVVAYELDFSLSGLLVSGQGRKFRIEAPASFQAPFEVELEAGSGLILHHAAGKMTGDITGIAQGRAVQTDIAISLTDSEGRQAQAIYSLEIRPKPGGAASTDYDDGDAYEVTEASGALFWDNTVNMWNSWDLATTKPAKIAACNAGVDTAVNYGFDPQPGYGYYVSISISRQARDDGTYGYFPHVSVNGLSQSYKDGDESAPLILSDEPGDGDGQMFNAFYTTDSKSEATRFARFACDSPHWALADHGFSHTDSTRAWPRCQGACPSWWKPIPSGSWTAP